MDNSQQPIAPVVEEVKYLKEEQGEAWGRLYERFGEVPVPDREVWKIEADRYRIVSQLAQIDGLYQKMLADLAREKELREKAEAERDRVGSFARAWHQVVMTTCTMLGISSADSAQDSTAAISSELSTLRAELSKKAGELDHANQLVCDYAASAMIDVDGQGGPCRVEPHHIEHHIASLIARAKDAESSLAALAVAAMESVRITDCEGECASSEPETCPHNRLLKMLNSLPSSTTEAATDGGQ
jgi:hypothetical protein